jgi:hypothetical protein
MSLPPIVEVPQELIVVERDGRQRSDLDPAGVERLAADIRRHGLLNALIVEDMPELDGPSYVRLIAGERRLAACRSLGWSHIPCRFWDELSQLDRSRLEWSENAHRTDLPWPDRVRAIAAYDQAARTEHPRWSLRQTAEDLGFGSNKGWIAKCIAVAEAAKTNEVLWSLSSIDQAYNAIERKFGRELGVVLAAALDAAEIGAAPDPDLAVGNGLDDEELGEEDALENQATLVAGGRMSFDTTNAPDSTPSDYHRSVRLPAPAPPRFSLHENDFADWAAAYAGPPFTVLHLDPPYGVGFTNTGMFRKANALDDIYDDQQSDLDGFWKILTTHWRKLVAPAAHVIYWFGTDTYVSNYWRWQDFAKEFDQPFHINPAPLIWHKSNNRGMMSVATRDPRKSYEWAFLITVGGQTLARPMGTNLVSEPADPNLHPSAKPLRVVRTWLAGVVGPDTRLLDPTCGHGSAIQAALELGAREAVGVELDPTHVARARVEIATRERELRQAETASL